ncbi:MAG: exodeoxyribonuclease VII large subunit [Pseudomonadota bacterium]
MQSTSQRKVLTVSQLNKQSKKQLESFFGLIWIEGEISSLSFPASGHWYFSLKDQQAQVKAAMFRNANRFLKFQPEVGTKVLVRTKVSLFEPRGDYQLIVEYMEPYGQGALQLAYEQLKNKLESQGLFATENKKALPRFTRSLGIITSPSGAAIHDILQVLNRRSPNLPVIIYPSQVQGEKAATQIQQALTIAIQRNECDLLLLTRGGGSMEDLWCFNDEKLAYTIANCPIPIVSAVGHEVDFTIADFVSDCRAPTPSAAAEIVSPDQQQLLQVVDYHYQRLQQSILSQLDQRKLALRQIQKRLKHPSQELILYQNRLQELVKRLRVAEERNVNDKHQQLMHLQKRLFLANPSQRVAQHRARIQELHNRLLQKARFRLQEQKTRLAHLTSLLQQLSPLTVLQRGYSVTKKASGEVISDAGTLQVGDKIKTQLASGSFTSQVLSREN